jgi:hypothetical protein
VAGGTIVKGSVDRNPAAGRRRSPISESQINGLIGNPAGDYQPAADNPSSNGRVIPRHLRAHVDAHHTTA